MAGAETEALQGTGTEPAADAPLLEQPQPASAVTAAESQDVNPLGQGDGRKHAYDRMQASQPAKTWLDVTCDSAAEA